MKWTSRKLKELKQMKLERVSDDACAMHFGVTLSSIRGARRRNGIHSTHGRKMRFTARGGRRLRDFLTLIDEPAFNAIVVRSHKENRPIDEVMAEVINRAA